MQVNVPSDVQTGATVQVNEIEKQTQKLNDNITY
jgi:hypothetical protein